jgi:uncharacterized protein YyaL (SSP411 family)
MLDGASPRAYLCVGRTCAAPVEDPAELRELIGTYHG